MFKFDVILDNFGKKNSKRVIQSLDIKKIIKNYNKTRILQNILLSPKAKVMYKIMIKNFSNFEQLLTYFNKKRVQE